MAKGTKVTEELKERAIELRAEGKSYAEIGKELGIGSSTAFRVSQHIKPTEEVEKPQFLDNESRFLELLKSYGIKDAARIVSYISSQGETAYTNLAILKRCLIEQGVPSGKVAPVLRHHAAIEQIPVPERLAAELAPEAPARQSSVRRFCIINNLPVPDPEGDYTFNEALRVIGTKSSSGDDDTKSLLAGIYKKLTDPEGSGLSALKDEIRAMREERVRGEIAVVATSLQGLRSELTAIKNSQQSKSEYDIMDRGLGVIDKRLGSIESGIMSRWAIPPRPLAGEAKEELTQAISEESVAERELDALADVVFYGGKGSAEQPKRVVVPQPPQDYE